MNDVCDKSDKNLTSDVKQLKYNGVYPPTIFYFIDFIIISIFGLFPCNYKNFFVE